MQNDFENTAREIKAGSRETGDFIRPGVQNQILGISSHTTKINFTLYDERDETAVSER